MVVDKSSPQIKKKPELKKRFATSKPLKSKKIDLGINNKGLSKASADIRRLTADLGKLKSVAGAVHLRVGRGEIHRPVAVRSARETAMVRR